MRRRLVEFVEVSLDTAEDEQGALVGGPGTEDGFELLGGVLGFFLAQIQFSELFAHTDEAWAQLDERNEQPDGLLVFAPQFIVVGQSMDRQRTFRLEGIGLVECGDDAGLDVADLGFCGEAGVPVKVGDADPEFRLRLVLGQRSVEDLEGLVKVLGRGVKLGQSANGDQRRLTLCHGSFERRDGFGRLVGLLVGEAKPLVGGDGVRVGRLAKPQHLDRLVGLFLLEITPRGQDDDRFLLGIGLGGGLKVLERVVRFSTELKTAAGEIVGQSLDPRAECLVLWFLEFLEILSLDAGGHTGTRCRLGHSGATGPGPEQGESDGEFRMEAAFHGRGPPDTPRPAKTTKVETRAGSRSGGGVSLTDYFCQVRFL